MRVARFKVERSTDSYLLLRDLGPWSEYLTITNAAEDVVAGLAGVLGNRRLLYYDSDGELTELIVTDGHFTGFAPGKLPDDG